MITATLVYEAPQGFITIARLIAKMAAVPLPAAAIAALGGIVASDTTAAGGTGVRRTIVLNMTPSVADLAHVTLSPGTPSGSFINGTAIDNPGQDLALPPQANLLGGGTNIIQRGRLRSFLNVGALAFGSGGANYSAGTIASVIGAMPPPTAARSGLYPAPACVQSLKLVNGGQNYTTSAIVQFQGGLGPGGVAATGVCTVNAATGRVTGVQLTSPGANYIHAPEVIIYNPTAITPKAQFAKVVARMGVGTPATINLTIPGPPGPITVAALATAGDGYVGIPSILVFDPAGTGSGAVISTRMQLSRLDVVTPGQGYSAAPAVQLLSPFEVMFPAGSDRTKPFRDFMVSAFAQASVGPVTALAPVVV